MPTAQTSSMSEKRVFLVLSLLVALIDLSFVSLNHYFTHQALLDEFNVQRDIYEQALNAQVNSTTDNLVLVASLFANKPEIQELFHKGKQAVEAEGGGKGGAGAAAIRQALYDFVAPEWNKAINEQNARQLHFHLGPGSLSFLRVHKRKKFGDRMDDIRHVIVATNDDHQVHTGFETGRVYSGLRGVVPVWYTDADGRRRYVGALEAGTGFVNTLKSLDRHFGVGAAVLLFNSHLRETVWPEFADKRIAEGIGSCDCVEEAVSRPAMRAHIETVIRQTGPLDRASDVRLVSSEERHFILAVAPVRDFLGQLQPQRGPVGVAVFWRDVTEKMLQYQNEQNSNILFGVFSYLAVELLIFVFIRRITRYLREQVAQATSDLHHSLTETEQANRTLAESSERQKQLFAIIGHELRTPAASIKMALDDIDSTQLGGHGQVLKDTSEHLLSVLDDMRYVASPERSVESRAVPDRVSDLVARVVGSLSFLLQKNGIQVHLEAAGIASETCVFKVQMLRQVVTNLVKNAARHSGAAHLWIHIDGLRLEDGPIRYQLVFEDDGQGIDPADREKLFEAFYQGKSHGEGSGIGLHVSRSLARGLGGDLAFEERPQGGAVFRLTVELNPDTGAANDHQPGAIDKDAYIRDALSGKTVLLAEDTDFLRLMTGKALQKQGARVVSVENGRLALDACREQDFDMVVTDIMMPEMDGYELTRRLRAAAYMKPIVGVTGAMVGEESTELIAAGATEVIAKPIDLKLLADILNQGSATDVAGGTVQPHPSEGERVFDPQSLSDTLGNDPELLQTALRTFTGNTSEQLRQIRTSIEHQDMDAARHLAHTIKGAAATVTATCLSRYAREVEMVCKQGPVEQLDSAVDSLSEAYAQLSREIDRVLHEQEAR